MIDVLIASARLEQKIINPWFTDARSELGYAAEEIRQLAWTDIAQKQALESDLESFADLLDQAATLPMDSGSWPHLTSLIEQVVENAREIKAANVDQLPFSDESIRTIYSRLDADRLKLGKIAARAKKLTNSRAFSEVVEAAAKLGKGILEIGHYNVDRIRPGLGQSLREIGFTLYQIEIQQRFSRPEDIVDTIEKKGSEFATVVGSLQA